MTNTATDILISIVRLADLSFENQIIEFEAILDAIGTLDSLGNDNASAMVILTELRLDSSIADQIRDHILDIFPTIELTSHAK